jgi:hypothetical protein
MMEIEVQIVPADDSKQDGNVDSAPDEVTFNMKSYCAFLYLVAELVTMTMVMPGFVNVWIWLCLVQALVLTYVGFVHLWVLIWYCAFVLGMAVGFISPICLGG